ncbi:MAG: PDZ domain-containing protein [Caldilineaceae bacterium]
MTNSDTQAPTLLLRQPTVSQDHLAFVYAGDLWLANQDGSQPRRLTVHPGVKMMPSFSPDGQWLAYSAGSFECGFNVYVIPVQGGTPTQLTYHPGHDWVQGWTPDGAQILFSSARDAASYRYTRFFTVPLGGGYPTPLPLPMAARGAYSPNGTRLAYTAIPPAFNTWKRYRGGQTSPIWIFDLATQEIEEIPHENASDAYPCWLGETVYFLSDRSGIMNLFAYATDSKSVRQVTDHSDFDVRAVATGGGVVVYEQAGRIHRYDPVTAQHEALAIQVVTDLPQTRPHYVKATDFIRNAGLSPNGARVVFEARGEILTAPAKKGNVRNLTRTPAVHERFPAWSPDGKRIAYFSDAKGEYQLVLRDQAGLAEPEFIDLGAATFFYTPQWSPNGQKILYTDKRLNLFYVDLSSSERSPVLVDTDTFDHPVRSLDPVWSPDSKWIAYTKRLDNHLRAVFFYEVATATAHQITDGMSDAISACFSLDGKYLFFAASTNYGLNTGWLDMSSYERPIDRSLYVVVLNKDEPSPFFPESDEEKDEEAKENTDEGQVAEDKAVEDEEVAQDATDADNKDANGDKDEAEAKQKKQPKPVQIDLADIDQRIVALPLSARAYHSLQAGDGGKLFYLEAVSRTNGYNLSYFDFKERKAELFLEKISRYWLSYNGKKLLYRDSNNSYAIVETKEKPKADHERLKLDKMEVYVDPRAEWRQMFEEVRRIQRDYFYDAGMHGVDWDALCATYRPWLDYVGHRHDLNYLLAELMGELVVGHAYVGGGDMEKIDDLAAGLLGADYQLVDGYYQIARIYRGENWRPELRSPLTEPGVNVAEGDFLLAVNGEPLRAPANLFRHFAMTADRVTVLTVNGTPTLEGARNVTVIPIKSEAALRHLAWVEGNRRKVSELTNGRVAYVYMPDTGSGGYSSFNRYYFAQLDREAVIIDERFNGGGSVADYVIDLLNRPLLSHWATREGKVFTTPNATIFGPKVMIINEFAGSGGDALPQFFRRRHLGKLVGKRTWGGLVGIYDYPILMDGGFVTAPRLAIFSPEGQWEVENEGVAPDVEVEMTPKAVIAGHDPQLETAIELILAELPAEPQPRMERPASANRVAID